MKGYFAGGTHTLINLLRRAAITSTLLEFEIKEVLVHLKEILTLSSPSGGPRDYTDIRTSHNIILDRKTYIFFFFFRRRPTMFTLDRLEFQ